MNGVEDVELLPRKAAGGCGTVLYSAVITKSLIFLEIFEPWGNRVKIYKA